jgi:hypothetical protein
MQTVKTKPKKYIAEQFELPIAPIPEAWWVKVRFLSGPDARDFLERLRKLKDKGNSPLYGAVMVTALQKATLIAIDKEI